MYMGIINTTYMENIRIVVSATNVGSGSDTIVGIYKNIMLSRNATFRVQGSFRVICKFLWLTK